MKSSHPYHSSVSSLAVVGVAFLLLPVMNVQATALSGPITNPANGHRYYLLNTTTWTASEAEAITLGGHLVTINDVAENDWVFDTFVPLLPTSVPAVIWIGLNDAAQEGTFVWASSEPVTYTNWSPGQPDNGRGVEDYAHIWTPTGIPQDPSVFRQWNDFADNWPEVYGVVEVVPILQTPEPSSWALFGLGALTAWATRSYTQRKKLPPATSPTIKW